ncbi:MAG: thioredoxin domain-containing protein [Planctomycetota bacterium]
MTTTAPHKHTNRLIHATSPYLLQHAHNPVDWHEWGAEAIQEAKREDKPIFLSIGYSACHWCHVMERESFENEEIAALMNAHFVCIKVDREERPDLDDVYMKATQLFTGSGGWPMSVWLTPDLKPFYAGTYFPPESRWGRPGFREVLMYLSHVWRDEREKVAQQADTLTDAVRKLAVSEPGAVTVPHALVIRTTAEIARAFDPIKGGISGGGTNKFPPSMAMDLMLRAYHDSLGNADGSRPRTELLRLVELTLDKMAQGGIYDQLGGGIARYSTDTDWLVPHFEKMLYDQALVSDIYLKSHQLTHKPLYARIAREILDYVIADLQSPEGGYYSSRDADSEGEEGKFYVWSKVEIVSALGDEEAALFCDYYDVTEDGNWEGHNILNIPRPMDVVAKQHGLSVEQSEARLTSSRQKLLAIRERRVKPHLDDKVLAAWSGLMIESMARGYRVLDDERYRDSAVRAAEFVLSRMTQDGRLQRTYRGGKTHTPGFLDDHAFMISALLTLYETTFELRWLDAAVELNDQVLGRFRDEAEGGFFFSPADGERLLVRGKDCNDAAIPSGNSVQLRNLLRLSVLLGRKDLAEEAQREIRAFSAQLAASPHQSEYMLSALDFYHRRPVELAFVGSDGAASAEGTGGGNMEPLVRAAWQTYVPNVVFAGMAAGGIEAEAAAKRIPLLAGKVLIQDRAAAYVCRDYACRSPTTDPEELRRLLSR